MKDMFFGAQIELSGVGDVDLVFADPKTFTEIDEDEFYAEWLAWNAEMYRSEVASHGKM